jgi:type VI secretion system protein ImpL
VLKYIFGAILVIFTWAAILLLRLPEWIAIVVTVLVVGLLATLYLVRRFRARKAARDLERAIAAQADAHAKQVRPEQEADIRALQSEFLKAINALKASRLGNGGMEALYALPWYVIIGPPGAGKTTALRNSGLQFPYLSKGGAVRGIGGTRNCDWWLTNEAILLDTAGRYTSEDEDRDEWRSFLDLLKRSRPKKPIDGIMVAISVTDIAGADEDAVTRHAQRVRERVDEMMERLQMVVPVYVFFTKCDLVEGFVEIFGDLKKQERGQILGFTVPTGGEAAEPEAVFTEHFQELYESLQKRALRRVGQERRLETRELIYEFPEQFLLLHDQLASFVGTLFEANIYKETPILRGVYFTSGTQEGRPIDRVMESMVKAFGVAPRVAAKEPVTEAKSYFLRDVFANVIFPDRTIGVRSRDELSRQRRRAYTIGGTVFGCSLLVSTLPAYSFVKNRQLIASTEALVAQVAAHRDRQLDPDNASMIPLDKLEPLSQRVDELRSYEVGRPPPQLRFGMYSGSALYPKVKELYAEVLRTDMLKPLLRRDALAMHEFVTRSNSGRASGDDYARFYELLKLYLTVSAPRADEEPPLDDERVKWLGEQIGKAWGEEIGDEPNDPRQAQVRRHAMLYAKLLASDPKLAIPRDEKLVKELRLALTSTTAENMVLDPLISEISREGYDVSLATILGGAPGPLQSTATVRGAFTRRAWDEIVRGRLPQAGIGEPWVLGPEGTRLGKPADQARAVRTRYFTLYIQEWKAFLDSLRVKEATSPFDALTVLQDLTRGVPAPYGRIMREVAFNTHLEEEGSPVKKGLLQEARAKLGTVEAVNKAKSLMGSRPRELGPADVEAAFADFVAFGVPPTPPPGPDGAPSPQKPQQVQLDIYQEQLEFVRDALATYTANPESMPQLVAKLEGARTRVRQLIEGQPVGRRALFEALLWPPIEGASITTNAALGKEKAIPWCTEVVSKFEHNLKSKYPFNPSGPDAPLADVADFYKPDGDLWKHYQAKLANEVPELGDHFEFRSKLGGATPYYPQLLTFLKRSREITNVLFPAGAKSPLVEFEVRIRPAPGVASIVFDLDGQTIKTQNEPDRWYPLKWPGEGKTHGATIRVRGSQNLSETIQQEGDWGLFRLLEAGQLAASSSSRIFAVTWTLSSRRDVQITFDIKPSRTDAPFFGTSRSDKLLRSFRGSDVAPPHAIAQGGGCKVFGQ